LRAGNAMDTSRLTRLTRSLLDSSFFFRYIARRYPVIFTVAFVRRDFLLILTALLCPVLHQRTAGFPFCDCRAFCLFRVRRCWFFRVPRARPDPLFGPPFDEAPFKNQQPRPLPRNPFSQDQCVLNLSAAEFIECDIWFRRGFVLPGGLLGLEQLRDPQPFPPHIRLVFSLTFRCGNVSTRFDLPRGFLDRAGASRFLFSFASSLAAGTRFVP